MLCFNHRTDRTQRWEDAALLARRGYSTEFPRAGDAGLVLKLGAAAG